MTALRFKIGGRHQTSLASLWGSLARTEKCAVIPLQAILTPDEEKRLVVRKMEKKKTCTLHSHLAIDVESISQV